MKQPQTHMESNMFHFKQVELGIIKAVDHFKQQANACHIKLTLNVPVVLHNLCRYNIFQSK
jgi:hypothetical protein